MIRKISIIKTLGVSKLVFSAQNTSIPEGKVSEINSILFKVRCTPEKLFSLILEIN